MLHEIGIKSVKIIVALRYRFKFKKEDSIPAQGLVLHSSVSVGCPVHVPP